MPGVSKGIRSGGESVSFVGDGVGDSVELSCEGNEGKRGCDSDPLLHR